MILWIQDYIFHFWLYIHPVFVNLILDILYTRKYVYIYICMHVHINILVYVNTEVCFLLPSPVFSLFAGCGEAQGRGENYFS